MADLKYTEAPKISTSDTDGTEQTGATDKNITDAGITFDTLKQVLQYTNFVPDSEQFAEGATDWTNLGFVFSGTTLIDGLPAQGMFEISSDTAARQLRHSYGVGESPIDHRPNVFFAGYFAPGSQEWVHITAGATNDVGQSIGGDMYFHLSGAGALGTFVPKPNGGALVDAGINQLTGGYRCWCIMNTGGNATFGDVIDFGPADSDGGRIYTGTSSIAIYIRSVMMTRDTHEELPHIPTL